MPTCKSYCEHGGICVLQEGHDGLHDSRYCQWDDAHALTEDEADALLAETADGRTYLTLKAVMGDALSEHGPL